MKRNLQIISIETEFGAGTSGAKLGPISLISKIQESFSTTLKAAPIKRINVDGIEENRERYGHGKNIDAIIEMQERVMTEIEISMSGNYFPLIFSGDHVNSIGCISAVKNSLPQKRVGVIWIDAHADLHTPYTTPSGNMHGMPVAALLGIDQAKRKRNNIPVEMESLWQRLIQISSKGLDLKIRPSDLVYIGLRDFESEELELIDNLRIKYFAPDT